MTSENLHTRLNTNFGLLGPFLGDRGGDPLMGPTRALGDHVTRAIGTYVNLRMDTPRTIGTYVNLRMDAPRAIGTYVNLRMDVPRAMSELN